MPVIKTGPRGGKYYTKNGRKVYVKSKTKTPVSSRKSKSKHSKSGKKTKPRLKSGKAAGCSNAGKYKNVPKNLFCGPAGGACPGTFPCDSRLRCRSALSYARHAPDPEGIRRCIRRISRQKGF